MAAACVNDNIWLGWAILTRTCMCILNLKKVVEKFKTKKGKLKGFEYLLTS